MDQTLEMRFFDRETFLVVEKIQALWLEKTLCSVWLISFLYFGHFSCMIFFTMCSVCLFFLARLVLQDKQKIT